MEYSFDIEEAQQYGLNEAIFLKNVKFWILKNIANNENKFEVDSESYPELKGEFRTWTYNSVKSYQKLFPFWSPKQTRATIDSLLKQGVLLKGCYNANQYDRTCWYALRVECICPTRQMEMPKTANGVAKKGNSNTDSKPDSKPDNINTESENFEEKPKETVPAFVEADRQRAREAAREIIKVPAEEAATNLKKDVGLREILCMDYKLNIHQVDAAIDNFKRYILKADISHSEIEFRRHFVNWLPKNLDQAKVVSKDISKPKYKNESVPQHVKDRIASQHNNRD